MPAGLRPLCRHRRTVAFCAVALAAVQARAEDAVPEVTINVQRATPAPTSNQAPRLTTLVARERVLVRSAEGEWGTETDADGHFYIAASANSTSGALVGDLALSIWTDLDGTAGKSPTVFGSPYETTVSATSVEVLSLWVATQGEGLLKAARLGRQVTEHGSPVALDGLSLTLELYPPWLSAFLVGGRTVHFFSLHPERLEDWLGSAGLTIRPVEGLRLEVDYRLTREATAAQKEIINNAYGVAAWYRASAWLQLRTYLRAVDDAISKVGGAARVVMPSLDVGLEATIHTQPMALDELNVRDDPFFSLLGRSQPFWRWRLDGWAGVETTLGNFAIHLGGDGRHLLDGVESAFNRNFGRLYVLGNAHDLLLPGLYVSVSLARHSDGLDLTRQGVWAVTGALGYRAEKWRAEIGSGYDQYKVTYYQTVDELEDVRTFYADGRLPLASWLTARVRYQLELLAWTHHTITFSLTQSY